MNGQAFFDSTIVFARCLRMGFDPADPDGNADIAAKLSDLHRETAAEIRGLRVALAEINVAIRDVTTWRRESPSETAAGEMVSGNT